MVWSKFRIDKSKRQCVLTCVKLLSLTLLATYLTRTILRYYIIKIFVDQVRTLGLKPSERQIFQDLISTFDDIARKKNISYFLTEGSLLGFARIGDILPWDDDVDLAMDEGFREHIEDAISTTAEYGSYFHNGGALKVFPTTPNNVIKRHQNKWNWPYLDILITRKSHNQLEERIVTIGDNFTFSVKDVYPLQEAVFMGRKVLVPHNAIQVLKMTYGDNAMEECQVNHQSHRLEKMTGKGSLFRIECKEIWTVLQQEGLI